MQKQFTRKLQDEAATMRLGAQLAPLLDRGDFVALSGGLGSGKTVLARGLISALCPTEEAIPSPTFTLVQTYHAQFDIWHVDLYRLDEAREIKELGLLDALEDAALVVEWPEKMGDELPKIRLEIQIIPIDNFCARKAVIIPYGEIWDKKLNELNTDR